MKMYCCRVCGSTDVYCDAWAALNSDVVHRYNDTHCGTCEGPRKVEEVEYQTVQVIFSSAEDDVLWVNVPVDGDHFEQFEADCEAAGLGFHRIIDGDTSVDLTYPEHREEFLDFIRKRS